MDKFAIQDSRYELPYHFVPQRGDGRLRTALFMRKAHVYLSYISHCAEIASRHNWQSLLDVGCGDGRLCSMLLEQFSDRRVVGIDLSERAISLAKVMVPQGTFVAGDITQHDALDETFDMLTCVETLEHIEPEKLPEFIQGLRQCVREGGKLVVTVPSKNLRMSKKHYQHFTDHDLRKILMPHFQADTVFYINGTNHRLKILSRIFMNRVYVISNEKWWDWFYRFYTRNYFLSTPQCGSRVFGVFSAV